MDLATRLLAHEANSGALRHKLAAPALARIHYFLTQHFPDGRELHTAETGCGTSTVLFSCHARHHTAYCDPDSDLQAPDIRYVKTHPEFVGSNVEFEKMPLSGTEFSHPAQRLLDIVLINGMHAYPTPDMELFALRRRLKSDGVLIISDVRIPTIRNLFDFLCQEESLRHHSIIDGVAFFLPERSQEPGAAEDDWRGQRYNRLLYPAMDPAAYTIGFALPFSVEFKGGLKSLPPMFTAGFGLVEGKPATEGRSSTIILRFDRDISGEVEVTIKFDLLAWSERQETRLRIRGEGSSIELDLSGARSHSASMRMELNAAKRVRMRLVAGDPLANIVIAGIEGRHVAENPEITQGQRTIHSDGSVVEFEVSGTRFRFFVMDPHDSIQAHHFVGQIYELEELNLIARHMPAAGCRILDVGANIGNHAVWFEKVLQAARVVVIEPQPAIISLLKINCLLNDIRNVDQSLLGLAFGREEGKGRIHIADAFNAAGGALMLDERGSISVMAGDQVLAGEHFDLIKIDVEGAELDVLIGLKTVISRCLPVIFVEVWDNHREAFLAYVDEIGYVCVDEMRRYPICSNLLLKPRTATGA